MQPTTDSRILAIHRHRSDLERAERPAVPQWPTDFAGGGTYPRDFNTARPDVAHAPIWGRSALAIATNYGHGDHAALASRGIYGARDGRIGGVRKATGSSSEHIAPLASEDFDAGEEVAAAVWLQCVEAVAKGARWRIPGKVRPVPIDATADRACTDLARYTALRTRGAKVASAAARARSIATEEGCHRPEAQRVRSPYAAAYTIGHGLGQRRRIHRLRLRDGITEPATDHIVPVMDRDLDDAARVAAVAPKLREAYGRAMVRYQTDRASNGNALRDLRKVASVIGREGALSLARVAEQQLATGR